MPYREPIFFDGGHYHVYSRGCEKRLIFLNQGDYKRFLARLKDYKDEFNVSILCYCLMPNHYHLLIKQSDSGSVRKFVYKLNLAYAMYFNKKYDRVGPLFQGRFKAKLIDKDQYLLHLSRYIHLNPLVLVGKRGLGSYFWSSARNYLDSRSDDLVDTEEIAAFFVKESYADFLKAEADEKMRAGVENLLFEEVQSPASSPGLGRGA